jgi:ABC-type phosphate transport system ATPase subunit
MLRSGKRGIENSVHNDICAERIFKRIGNAGLGKFVFLKRIQRIPQGAQKKK